MTLFVTRSVEMRQKSHQSFKAKNQGEVDAANFFIAENESMMSFLSYV